MPFTYPYPRPAVTADVVLLSMRAGDLSVLLIKRKHAPFKGSWALPGGFAEETETLERAALRELQEETGIANVKIEQLGAFGDPGRDPRGHTVTIAYFACVVAESLMSRAGDDASAVAWIPLRRLALAGRPTRRGAKIVTLAFDHDKIIQKALRVLQERLNDPLHSAPSEIVTERFTLAQLQGVYEAVFGYEITPREFQKRLLAQRLVVPVLASKRPKLYRWRKA